MNKHFLLILAYLLSSYNAVCQQFRSTLLKDISRIEVRDNKLIYVDTVVLQINERMGDHDAFDRMVYQKGEKASFGNIILEDSRNNLIRKIGKKEIEERSYIRGFSLYEDRMEKFFEAKHHHYPYVLKYTKQQETKKYISIAVLNYSRVRTPVKKGELIIELPIDRKIKQKFENIDSYHLDTIDQVVYHKYTYSHKPNRNSQLYESVNTNIAPKIIVAPIDFKYGIEGRNENWNTLGEWIYNLNKGRDKLPQSEKDKIDLLIGEEKNKYEQIKILYEYLQDNTRYVNVSTQIGGLQTHPAEYVVNNRYGDCKALSNYMQAMLAHINVESFYTLIYNNERIYDLEDDFSYNAFNHVILTVPLQNDTIMLECTSKNTPMGYIGTSNQGRKVLMVKEGGSKLIKTPTITPRQTLCSRVFDISILNNGDANITLDSRLRGYNYEVLNAYEEGASRSRVDNYIRENVLDGTFNITDYKLVKESKDSAHIDLNIEAEIKDICKKYGNNIVINPLPIYLPQFESVEERTADLQIDYPIYRKDKIKIDFEDIELKQMPRDKKFSSPFGDHYSIKFHKEGKSVIIEKEVLVSAKRLNLEEYKDFHSFMRKARNSELSNFYFEIL